MRTSHRTLCQLLALLLAVLLSASPTAARLIKAEIYPQGARLFERISPEIPPGAEGAAAFFLPLQADPDTLDIEVLRPETAAVSGLSFEKVQAPRSERVKELTSRIDDLERQRASLKDELQTSRDLISFWKNQLSHTPEKTEDIQGLAQTIQKHLQATYASQTSQQAKLEKLEKDLKEAEKELEELTGGQKQRWRVSLLIDGGFEGSPEIACSYRIKNIAWEPVYAFNARPAQQQVDFTWKARIVQKAGLDWRGVPTRIATAERPRRIEPPRVRPWIIKPRQDIIVAREAVKAERKMGYAADRAAAAPQRERRYLYDAFDLGETTLPPGKPRLYAVRQISSAAAFDYLVRPLESQQAFLRARLEKGDALERLPRGQALLQIEGAVVGRMEYSSFNPKKPLFFGIDPQVQVEAELLEKKSGERGIINQKKTYRWLWQVRFTNNRSQPIDLTMETAWPQARDERIALSRAEKEAQLTLTDHVLEGRWSLPPGAEKEVRFGVEASYPEDMKILPGR
jgi:hypothetical protein